MADDGETGVEETLGEEPVIDVDMDMLGRGAAPAERGRARMVLGIDQSQRAEPGL